MKGTRHQYHQTVGPEQITEIFFIKYENLFNSVPTFDSGVKNLHNVLANNISFDTRNTPGSARFCVAKLRPLKDGGKYGFKARSFN